MKETPTHIYFWNGIYSNWHPAPIIDFDTSLKFANTEQAFMWYKAQKFGDVEALRRIEKEPDPRKVKAIGREIKGYDDDTWNTVRYDIMMKVNRWKFTQIKRFQRELLATGDKIIVEASPYDKIWGVGLLEDDPLILDEKNWQGLNLLGKVCMDLRTELRKAT